MRFVQCGREASRLRLERCNACYMRRYRNGEVPGGSVCAACGERRRASLTLVTLGGRIVLCGNCGLVLTRTRPRILSVVELRRCVARERRSGSDRRAAWRGGRRSADERSTRRVVSAPFDPSVD
jgi:hypothetical protein